MATYASPDGHSVRRVFVAGGLASAVLAVAPALAPSTRKVARALCIPIPQSILLRADRIVE